MDLIIIFLTGLTTGGLSCFLMQGGLLASLVANQNAENKQNKNTSSSNSNLQNNAVLVFLISKLIAHTLVGFLLGFLGSKLTLSLEIRLIFQTFTAFFMFATAMNLLNVHPIFRYVVLRPPKFIFKYIKDTTNSRAFFAPALLGALTIFIPCGVTQAMEVLAINSASPIYGAMIMFSFVLGTSPIFYFAGLVANSLTAEKTEKLNKIASYILLAMAFYAINGVAVVLNFPITLNRIVYPITYFFSEERFKKNNLIETQNGKQVVKIDIYNDGYSPKYFKVKKDVPVELTLQSHEAYTCAVAFVFKEFGINTFLDATDTQKFEFVPTKKGKFTYSCSMGMYSGVMVVE